MKKIKKNCKTLATFLSITLLFGTYTSCSKNIETSNKINKLDLISGEDIFRGLFFLEGDFVEEIPTLYQQKINNDALLESPITLSSVEGKGITSNIELKEHIKNFRDSIINQVKEIDPTIFNDIKNSIKNGNVDELDNKIRHAAGTLNTALIQNESVAEGAKIVDLAYKEGNIDPKKYDLTKAEGIEKYNNDILNFVKTQDIKGSGKLQEQSGVLFVWLVVAYLLVAAAAYLVLAIGGGVLFFIGGGIYVEIYNYWGGDPNEIPIVEESETNFTYNSMLSETIIYGQGTY
ncbi:hypothetical protein [uncultured Maribacter sp.]|uniref:hypothetical protein n=1 Tax=uncultured Maribacter sp. TaxID=431308 RepID=UPI002639EF0C|nr:hypothetical protein [uncultured Maribacter sp.]